MLKFLLSVIVQYVVGKPDSFLDQNGKRLSFFYSLESKMEYDNFFGREKVAVEKKEL